MRGHGLDVDEQRLGRRGEVAADLYERELGEQGEGNCPLSPGRSWNPRPMRTSLPSGHIAAALGIAIKTQAKDEGSKVGYVGYVKALGKPAAKPEAVAAIEVQNAEVHLEFDRLLKTRLAGRSEPDARKAVLIGASAIGSHLADCIIREERFPWTIVDDDRHLPHNLARHVAHSPRGQRASFKVARLDLTDDQGVCLVAVAAPLALVDRAFRGFELRRWFWAECRCIG
jgi:hypothetical protein